MIATSKDNSALRIRVGDGHERSCTFLSSPQPGRCYGADDGRDVDNEFAIYMIAPLKASNKYNYNVCMHIQKLRETTLAPATVISPKRSRD